jgi:hypothetical protein
MTMPMKTSHIQTGLLRNIRKRNSIPVYPLIRVRREVSLVEGQVPG